MLNIYWNCSNSDRVNAVLCGCTIRIGNIQSDVKEVRSGTEIGEHKGRLYLFLDGSHWYWIRVEFAQYKQRFF
jgi:hypothetical protein